MEQANCYLEEEYLPWWNQRLVVAPANTTDGHRPLGVEHDLAAALSCVETRQVTNDYTIRFEGQVYQIAPSDIRPGLRGGTVRVESRLDGTLAVRSQQCYVAGEPVSADASGAARGWSAVLTSGADTAPVTEHFLIEE